MVRPGPGDANVRETLRAMRDMARAVIVHPLVRQTAATAVEFASPRDRSEQAYALRAWMADHLRFLRDPAGLEYVQPPLKLLTEIRDRYYTVGDCDDIATLGAALGLSIGIPARFRALAFSPTGPMQHVVADLLTPQPVDLDVSKVPGAPVPSRVLLLSL